MDESTFSYYAPVSPETFGTEHYVYAKVKLNHVGNDKMWLAAPLMSGRTAATSQFAHELRPKEQSDAQATKHWQHRVSVDEANLGVATYLWSIMFLDRCMDGAKDRPWRMLGPAKHKSGDSY